MTINLPFTPELFAVSRRIIWFEEPETALQNATRFIAYAMRYATHPDMQIIRRFVDDDALRNTLRNAPPGIIDARSWAYWHVKLGILPIPSLPVRRLV